MRRFTTSVEQSYWQWNFFGIGWNSPVYKITRSLQCLSEGGDGNIGCGQIIGDGTVSKEIITIFSDNQAAVRALSSNEMKSKTVYVDTSTE